MGYTTVLVVHCAGRFERVGGGPPRAHALARNDEMILGGTRRTLPHAMTPPVLMSH